METFARWRPPPPPAAAGRVSLRPAYGRRSRAATVSPRAFGGGADFDGFVRRAWRGANAGAERLAFEVRQTAQRLDGRFSISRRLAEAARAARARAVEIDAELGIGRRWRSFSVDFSRNWPRYRRELTDFMATPIGRAFTGTCPACKRRFVGYRNQVIRCMNCQNIVWQPNNRSSGRASSSRSSGPDVIDVEFEEK
ncbi:Os10g0569000 [Oryza sativa Japonica Group]|uniref:Os10g0569000 protein n=1 Tax=Oryza sativa subsp. japonica TaxID=39947 RepID=Q0IVI4_ORYSJ|nr:Os10g0569000 [Oryza sativa Japonica Group]|eukprot:NP_001065444.1 Os10g0569000 [Oryza sativa Japonica Group]